MMRNTVTIPGLTVIWPVGALPASAASRDGIARRLDHAQARLEAVETLLAGRAPQTPLPAAQAQEVREIQRLVAALTADVLGTDHPLVAQLQGAGVRHVGRSAVVAPAPCPRRSWRAGPRVPCPVPRLVRLLRLRDRWSLPRA